MKEALRKILSISMALIVLFSTMSFTVDMHYCGDHLVDFSLSEKVDTCMMKAKMSKSSECAVMNMDMDCCTDIEVIIEGQDDVKVSFDHFNFEQQLFITSFFYAYINVFERLDEEKVIPFKDYAPPPLIRDIHILDQTFLI